MLSRCEHIGRLKGHLRPEGEYVHLPWDRDIDRLVEAVVQDAVTRPEAQHCARVIAMDQAHIAFLRGAAKAGYCPEVSRSGTVVTYGFLGHATAVFDYATTSAEADPLFVMRDEDGDMVTQFHGVPAPRIVKKTLSAFVQWL
jgi:hypothetical protein